MARARLLVLGFESAEHAVDDELARALGCCAEHGGTWDPPGAGAGNRQAGAGRTGDSVDSWRDAFLRAPYLRDTLVAIGVLSETFESAVTWDRFDAFIERRSRGDAGRRSWRRAAPGPSRAG